jgi:hypothetical protein
MDSSELTRKRKNRLLYSSYIAQQIKFNGGCALRIQLGPGNDNTAASLVNIQEGALYVTPVEQSTILTLNACPFRIIQPTGGSLRFTAGATPTNLSFTNDASLRPGTSAFTVEWFQYYQDSDVNAIVFSIGTFPANDLCIVYADRTLFLFTDGSASNVGSAVTKNIWQHIAVVGNGAADGSRNVRVYVDGALVLTRTANYNINQTDNLRIGNQTDASVPNGNYAGLITNFRWVVGTAVYTSDFTKPSAPLSAISGTQLLLAATNSSTVIRDSSSANRTATNSGVIYDAATPFS